jgi:DNA-binding GntR family transcriptional regulator
MRSVSIEQNVLGSPDGGSSDGSRADLAYRQLKAAIRRREFRPGQRMREADLAEWLNISRTPVRDALKQLETEGLLVAAPRRGLVVVELDQQQVTEIYALRNVLEGLAARMAAQHASPAEVAAMRDAMDRQDSASIDDFEQLAHLNRTFHQSIYHAARNRYLLEVLEGLESTLALLPGTTYSDPSRPERALDEHRVIVDAIERRDPDTAEAAARQHIFGSERIRLRMMTEMQPD